MKLNKLLDKYDISLQLNCRSNPLSHCKRWYVTFSSLSCVSYWNKKTASYEATSIRGGRTASEALKIFCREISNKPLKIVSYPNGINYEFYGRITP